MLATIVIVTFACLPPQAPTERAQPLRVITYNVHAWGPVATTDAGKQRLRKIQARGQLLARLALELKLHEPDVIALQEAHSEAKVKQLAALMKMDYAYFPGGWKGKGWREGISGAILSRPKIIARENRPSMDPKIPEDKLFSRCFGRVVIEHDKQRVAIYCAHMLPSWQETTHIREAEIRAITVATNKDLQAGRSVIVMGDMNHDTKAPEYRLWEKAQLVDTARQLHQDKALLTCPSEKPKERIDFVFVAGPLKARLRRAHALQEGAFMVHKTLGSSFALSDHIPVFAEFR
ncbi:MAG: endonuclease/exonuclease/phosphatase family metal-dependent hydrolase [Planctomycetota bacterium]|jgi:endonuclease/exonuclease/phosphatase family metal-dependent hydrolase